MAGLQELLGFPASLVIRRLGKGGLRFEFHRIPPSCWRRHMNPSEAERRKSEESRRDWNRATKLRLHFQELGNFRLMETDCGANLNAEPSVRGEEDDEMKRFLRVINRRFLAAQPSDFVDVASRHRKNGLGAGVVGVTVGASKAKIVARLLSLSPCPISGQFIDTHCALALLAELSRPEFRRFVRGPGRRLLSDLGRWSADSRMLIPAEVTDSAAARSS